MSTSEDPSGTSTSRVRDAASTPPSTCRVEVEIRRGHKAIPKRLRINGFEIPNVTSVTAKYVSVDVRRVFIELMPTDFVEVDVESEQSPADAGTVTGP